MEADRIRALRDFLQPQVPPELVEAIGAEMDRFRRAGGIYDYNFGDATPDEVARQIHVGEGPLFDAMNVFLQLGDPRSQFEGELENLIQNDILSDYTGLGWLPSQVEELGRMPEPKEMSPGGRMAHELAARAKFIRDRDLEAYEKSKTFDPRDTQGTGLQQFLLGANNPETGLGTYMTKMGNVFADAASQAGDALLGAGNIENSVGDAFVRSNGADWNRLYPMLTSEDGDWRSRDALIEQGRRAFAESEGMDANKFIQTSFNNAGLDYYPNPISNMTAGTAVTVGNGIFDGSYGGPAKQILEELASDGGLAGGLNVYTQGPKVTDANEYMNKRPSIAENQQAFRDDNAKREHSIKVLENIDDQVRHPQQEMFQHPDGTAQRYAQDAMLAYELGKNAYQSATNAIAGAIEPVVGAVDEGLTKAQRIAKQAAKSYRSPLGNAIPR